MNRWEHDEGMDYRQSIADAVEDRDEWIEDHWVLANGTTRIIFAQEDNPTKVNADFRSVESLTLTFDTPDEHGARMSMHLTKVLPTTVARMISEMLHHG